MHNAPLGRSKRVPKTANAGRATNVSKALPKTNSIALPNQAKDFL
jgi:hypothetical protein